jgi:hypothetical protein
MLEKLHLKNVGPAPELEMEFAPRLNIITGDNGLGKSFILDVAWFALTNNDWLKQENSQMQHGNMIRPSPANGTSLIDFRFFSQTRVENYQFMFQHRHQVWEPTDVISPDSTDTFDAFIVLQVFPDGEFGVYDPYRSEPLGFSTNELWDGLERFVPRRGKENPERQIICNGLIRDWNLWSLGKSATFQQLQKALEVLSPHENEKLAPTKSTRVSINDARDIPTLKMSYGEVPVTQTSSGIKRIMSLAYLLIWTWQEHLRIAELQRLEPNRKIVLLIDELEIHLHPQWQRKILASLLNAIKEIMQDDVEIQIIATTHSPLVMASLEPLFDPKQDAWFDFNLVKGEVTLEKMPWYKRGDAEKWLISDAFDLGNMGTGSVPREKAMLKAAALFREPKVSKKKFLEIDRELRSVLGEMDDFWIRWRFLGEKKGWL